MTKPLTSTPPSARSDGATFTVENPLKPSSPEQRRGSPPTPTTTVTKTTTEASTPVAEPSAVPGADPAINETKGLSPAAMIAGAAVGAATLNPVAGLAAAAGTDYAIKETKKEGKGVSFKTIAKIGAMAAVGAALFYVAPPLFAVGLAATAAMATVKIGSMALEGLGKGMSKMLSGMMGLFKGKKGKEHDGPEQARSQEQTVAKAQTQQLAPEAPALAKAQAIDTPPAPSPTTTTPNVAGPTTPIVNPLVQAAREKRAAMPPEIVARTDAIKTALTSTYRSTAATRAVVAARGKGQQTATTPGR